MLLPSIEPPHIAVDAHPARIVPTSTRARRIGLLAAGVEMGVIGMAEKFQVLNPVVAAVAVDVVDVFARHEHTPERQRHDVPVFEHVSVAISHRMSLADMQQNVAPVVRPSTTPPMCTTWSRPVSCLVSPATSHVAESVGKDSTLLASDRRSAVVAGTCDHRPPPSVDSVVGVRGNSERSRAFGLQTLAAPLIIHLLRVYQRGTTDAGIVCIRK